VARDWKSVQRRTQQAKEPYSLCWPVRDATVRDAAMLSRAQGCLLGQFAGDSLGSLVEFQSAAEIKRSYSGGVRVLSDGGTWNTLAGQPTDDSEMALMLARSIVLEGRVSAEAAARAYVWWYNTGPFDIGNTTRAALAPLAAGRDKQANRESQANGALMRISPLGVFGAEPGHARDDAAITHPNPICQDANAVFASAIAFAIRSGAGAAQVYAHARGTATHADVITVLDTAAHAAPESYTRNMGWVLVALQNAFWQLLHAETFEDGVVATVMAGGDTDTNAAIAGALLGAVHGREAVPRQWRNQVLSCRPITGMTGIHKPRPSALWPVDALWLAERLLFLGQAG
jgi:ADP-ribosylglycohydrolase